MSSAAANVLVQWSGKATKSDAVAAQMLGLRQAAADEDGYPLARASVMNLIAFASAPAQQDVARRSVDELAIRHPSRAIVVALEPGKTFTLDAEVFLYRHPLADHGLVYERALLRAHGADPEGLDTLVIPLLIPHLQSFLWWLGDPDIDHPGLRSLGAICDRLVVDTATGPAERLRDLSQLLGNAAGTNARVPAFARLVLGDLAWSRLEGFRRTLVQVFDEGDRAEFLEGVTSVEIQGVRGARSELTSAEILCGGWLASRLGWTMPAWAPEGVSLKDGSRRVLMNFAGTPGLRHASGVGPPLHGVRLDAQIGRRKLSVELTASHSEAHLVVDEAGVGRASRTIPIPHMSETEALSRELARIGRDLVYEDAMEASSRILGALGS